MLKYAFYFCLATATQLQAQNDKAYPQLCDEARTLYLQNKFLESARKYEAAFLANDNAGYINDFYAAARSWARAQNADSALYRLTRISESGYFTDLDKLTNESDFKTLHSDPRWKTVQENVKLSKEQQEQDYDWDLIAILDSVHADHHKYRDQTRELELEYGYNSPKLISHHRKIRRADSVNLAKVQLILDTQGWLGPDVIGPQGSDALFLVIQNSDLTTQEKYLPLLVEAVKEGRAEAECLAMMQDRVAIRRGEKQTYGTQISRLQSTGEYFVSPLADPDHVDQRRAEVGLGSISEYVARWGIEWDSEQYKQKLVELDME